MVRDFRRSGASRRASCCQVLPLQSPGVPPSLGDIWETGPCLVAVSGHGQGLLNAGSAIRSLRKHRRHGSRAATAPNQVRMPVKSAVMSLPADWSSLSFRHSGPAQCLGKHGKSLRAGEVAFHERGDRKARLQFEKVPSARCRFGIAFEAGQCRGLQKRRRAESRVRLQRPVRALSASAKRPAKKCV